jgi:hypothetical protein
LAGGLCELMEIDGIIVTKAGVFPRDALDDAFSHVALTDQLEQERVARRFEHGARAGTGVGHGQPQASHFG